MSARPKAKEYGLIGYPLGHSLSPFIHEEIFKKNELRHNYSLYEIPPAELENKQHLLSSLDGFNVTVPLKELIIPLLDKLDKSAEFGAVNCVKENTGYNTDIFGFEKSIKVLGAKLKSRVCLLGYGGAGKMIAHAVTKAGGRLTIAEKDTKKLKACELKAELVKIGDLKGSFDLLINSTPVGMYPKVKASPIDFKRVNATYVLDLVYNPAKTKFLTLAEDKGAKTMNGLVMLVWQAIRSHDIWYGGKLMESKAQEIIEAVKIKAQGG